MADTKAAPSKEEKKIPFSKGLKAEFRKIIWPSKDDLTKQTVAVVSVSIALGVIIALIDMVLQYGINFLVK